jgi:putative Holliday junction resolvase
LRIIGVDFGDRRTGLAVSDPFGWTAQGVETVVGNKDAVIGRIYDLANQYGVDSIVVGYPINMSGSAGARAIATEQFAAKLEERTGVKVIKWDERLTTVLASKTMRATGSKPKKGKGDIDIVSAVLILQSYLDSVRNKAAQPSSQYD